MDNNGRNNVVYSLVQRDKNVQAKRHHEKRFWEDVFDNFEKDMGGTIREYDAIISKWKNSIRPKVDAFSVVYDGVQRMDENGSSDLVLFQNALAEFQTVYGHPFTMVACWSILKNHPAWIEIEVSTYQQRGLISMWDTSLFVKSNLWCNDNSIIIQGKWYHSDVTFYMVNVYGPQDSSAKSSLWQRLHEFILINQDLKAIVLDRLWSDHNHILLHIDKTNFGPIPFKFYNSWIQEWRQQSNVTNASHLHVIYSTLNDLDKKIDSSTATDEDLQSRIHLMKERDELDRLFSLDLAQKAKIQWDVEGDENSKFFHGILNQKRRHQSIHGILSDGEWIANPFTIKDEFYKFYKSKFKSFDSSFDVNSNPSFTTLFLEEVTMLQQQATFDETRKAVWDCGSSKSPGPDGFSFLFIKTYWDLFKDDIVNFVNHFMESGTMPKGTNSAFITLIPKTPNPILIKDYRPISLIGMQYKFIAKLLANRLSTVLDKLVSPTQSAFISGRQILDGPFMVSEIIEWYKKRNKTLSIA
ncbi:putative RNA-directed DNA polymerase, eukaryota, reverse transcriptase zinc-binding domain protein [Tanacetum coccineum]